MMEEGRGFPLQGCSSSSNFSTRNSTLKPNVGTILFSVDPGHLLISLVGHSCNQQTLAEYLPRPECNDSLQPCGETDMQMRTPRGEVLATVEDRGSGWEWGKEPPGPSWIPQTAAQGPGNQVESSRTAGVGQNLPTCSELIENLNSREIN